MIQDIYPHILHNQYESEAVATSEDTVLNISNGKILVCDKMKELNVLEFPKVKDFSKEYEYRYLFAVDEQKYYLINGELEESEIPKGFVYMTDRQIRRADMCPAENVFASITGKHLSDWYNDTRFCGRCGGKMSHSEKERAMVCKCGYTAYPRIMPAVIVGVINGDSLLITRYREGYGHNALIAGFTEIGETMEETVAREVMEETGIKVKNIRYYKSQPWGTANDILLGYYCELDGDSTISMDSNELKYAEWVERDEIELQPGNYSLTNEMMRMFKEGRE